MRKPRQLKPQAKRLLRRVIKHIKEEPKRFIMGSIIQKRGEEWFGYDTVYDGCSMGIENWEFPRCNTAACIAGWAAILAGKERINWNNGKRALGITEAQANRLFHPDGWDAKLAEKYASAETHKVRVNAAVAQIEKFIKEGI